MTVALRRQIKELGDSVPTLPQEGRDQLWRNVATELNHHHRQAASRTHRSTRAIWLMGVVTCAVFLVVVLPLLNQSDLLHTQMLEAAGRPERAVIFNSASETAHLGSGYTTVASNAEYDLLLHDDGMRFLIRHRPSGQTWSTSPDVRDARVPASQLGRLISPFSIRYGDASGRVDGWANPHDDATHIETYHISSGIGMRFVFESLGIAVRLDYQLGDKYLEVSIPENGIEAYGNYNVKAIEVFPFFQVRDDDGDDRLILASADGSDWDASLYGPLPQPLGKSQLLFGVGSDRFGYMAEVVEGGEYASVHVDPTGFMIDSHRVYVEFLMDQVASAQGSTTRSRPTVRYHAVVFEETGTDGVAELLQQHLRDARAGGRTAELVTFAG